jgi:uncharacterized membrane protein YkoI
MKKLVLIPLLLAVIFMAACSEEDPVMPMTENTADRPAFANITLSALSDTHTPYEHIFKSSSSTNGRMLNTPEDIRALMDKIEEIFPEANYIDDIETEEKRGIEVWEVEFELPGEEELEFYISKELFEVVEIEGEEINGTPAYEIDPGDNFVTLSQALNTAYAALENQQLEIEEWELSFDDGTWVYKFEIEEEEDIEVYVNAETGELIGIYDDDEDNDDEDNDDDDDDDD